MKKEATGQSFIRKEITTYRIGTLVKLWFYDKIHTSVQSSDGFLLFLKTSSAVLPSDLHSSGVDTGPYQALNQGMNPS